MGAFLLHKDSVKLCFFWHNLPQFSAKISTVEMVLPMVTSFSLVYSAAAVRRMLGDRFPVVRIEKWWKVCLVIFEGCRPRFMSRVAFLQHFVEWRKAQAKALQVTRNLFLPHCFGVRNESKGSLYTVQAFVGGIQCECEDYKNQAQFLGKACCKHGFAVLAHLGYSSLSDYIEHHRWVN